MAPVSKSYAVALPRPLFVSIREASRLIGVSNPSVRKLIANGTLTERRIGRRRLVMTESVLALAGCGAADVDGGRPR